MNTSQTYIVEPTSTILYIPKPRVAETMLRPLFCEGFVLGSCFVGYTLSVVSRFAIIRAGCFTLIAF